jgi:uracil phosphoribosyltransferase
MERIGEVLAYEISKHLNYVEHRVATPLGEAGVDLVDDRVVLGTILRAGLPLHQGLLNYFDAADNAFVSAYRKEHKGGTFEIELEYVSSPKLDDAVLILADPMLATGSSMVLAARALQEYGTPRSLHLVAAIGARLGVDYVLRELPEAHIWLGSLDEELTAKSYIVPGLGDAGDLSYGEKSQD